MNNMPQERVMTRATIATLIVCATVTTTSAQIGRDRLLWQRSSPDFAIYLPSGYLDGTNQQVVGTVTPKGTFIVTWTTGSKEGLADHRFIVSRSTDLGQTWSHPLVLDAQSFDKKGAGDGHRAQYGVPFVVPSTGRVYALYHKNTGQAQVRADITGILRFKYSDDDGLTWHDGGTLPISHNDFSHPDPKANPNFIGIYSPFITSKGTVLWAFARYKAGPSLTDRIPYTQWETEVCFLRLDNILTETDPSRLRATTLPKGGQGLRIPRHGAPGMVWGNEPSLIELSDGRLFTAIRTRNNAVYFAVSSDEGETWTQPEPLRDRDGNTMQNPNAPCPITKLSTGRIVLMYYNQPITYQKHSKKTFGARDPVYIAIGREKLDAQQPVEFGPPKEFMDIQGKMVLGGTAWAQIASYSSFVEHQGKLYLFYNDCKYFVLGKVVPEEFLRPDFDQ
jgi:hypothetical protein